MLIPTFFTVSGQFKIDNTSTTPIAPGCPLALGQNSDGESVVEIADGATTTKPVIGLAADGYLTEALTPPASGYAADIVTGAYGNATVRSTNRINDLYKETRGSGMMTVYSGVGTFRSSEYVVADSLVPGDKLYAGTGANKGKMVKTTSTEGTVIGVVVEAPRAYPNGVPGTTVDGSMSLGTLVAFNLKM